jgi:hypothetical protein
MITGSADGWRVLETLSTLVRAYEEAEAEIERARRQLDLLEEMRDRAVDWRRSLLLHAAAVESGVPLHDLCELHERNKTALLAALDVPAFEEIQ